jgi:hypothetical protein
MSPHLNTNQPEKTLSKCNGTKDFQANPEKLKRIEENVQGEYEIHVVENMDHD